MSDSDAEPGTPASDVWDAVAEAWERHDDALTALTGPVTDRLLALAGAAPGEDVLELAAGVGALSRALAHLVAPDGQVVGSDLSERMVAVASRRAADLPNLSFRALDAQRLDLPDDAVDLVVCRFGLMLLDDPAAAAAECRRVLRPDGRLVAATWGPLEHNLWITTFGAAMLAHGHAPPDDPTQPGGIFSLADRDTLTGLLTGAGFTDAAVEVIDLEQRFADFDGYWELLSVTAGSLAVTFATLEPAAQETVRATCEEYAAHLRQDDGSYVFPGQALVARGALTAVPLTSPAHGPTTQDAVVPRRNRSR